LAETVAARRAAAVVVGFVDIGWGGEGAAVFSGINYPF
jgi:hypothetical protein